MTAKARKSVLRPMTMNLDDATRKAIALIMQHSVILRDNAAVIRGISRKYAEQLEYQMSVEELGGRVLLITEDDGGKEVDRIRLDLRV